MDLGNRISRWVLAIGLWGCAIWVAKLAFKDLELQWLALAILLAIIGFTRVFGDILAFAAAPFTLMIDAIVFPRIDGEKPPPNYRQAEYYLKENRLDDADAEYRTILKNHRKETQAYLGLLRLLSEQNSIDEAKKVFKKAQWHLRNQPDDLNEVEMDWHHLKSQNFSV